MIIFLVEESFLSPEPEPEPWDPRFWEWDKLLGNQNLLIGVGVVVAAIFLICVGLIVK